MDPVLVLGAVVGLLAVCWVLLVLAEGRRRGRNCTGKVGCRCSQCIKKDE